MVHYEKINELSKKGYNCSQVVLCYFAEDFGLDEETALKISCPFEMGMYESGQCGAVTAGYMVLGLKYGSTDFDKRIELAKKTLAFKNEFKEKMVSTNCKELLGMKVMEGNNIEKAAEEGLLESVCGKAIQNAIVALEKLLSTD